VNRLLRFLLSAAIASAVVLALLVAALWAFGVFDREEEVIYAHPVEVLSQSDRVDVAELVGAPQRQLPASPVDRPVEPLVVPRREVSGFVQVEVEVDADGRVQRAEVVNALPAGVYEAQALRQVRQRRYPPREGGASYVEVVPFRVSADELPPNPQED
jgi:TonB family protein